MQRSLSEAVSKGVTRALTLESVADASESLDVPQSFSQAVSEGITRSLTLESVVPDAPDMLNLLADHAVEAHLRNEADFVQSEGMQLSLSDAVSKGVTRALTLESVVADASESFDIAQIQEALVPQSFSQAVSNGNTRSLTLESVAQDAPDMLTLLADFAVEAHPRNTADVLESGAMQRSLSEAVSQGVERALTLKSFAPDTADCLGTEAAVDVGLVSNGVAKLDSVAAQQANVAEELDAQSQVECAKAEFEFVRALVENSDFGQLTAGKPVAGVSDGPHEELEQDGEVTVGSNVRVTKHGNWFGKLGVVHQRLNDQSLLVRGNGFYCWVASSDVRLLQAAPIKSQNDSIAAGIPPIKSQHDSIIVAILPQPGPLRVQTEKIEKSEQVRKPRWCCLR